MEPDKAEPGVAPQEDRVHIARVTVDNEVFDISTDPKKPGSYNYDWVSGPNAGYGFASGGSRDSTPPSLEAHVEAIRSFLAQVDPETGYIE